MPKSDTHHGSARAEILRRIRAASIPASEAPGIRRQYRQTSNLPSEAILHLFEERVRDYDAGIFRTTPNDLRTRIEEILASRSRRRIAIPGGFPAGDLPAGFDFFADVGRISDLDACDGVLTTATLAIAETGSIVLQNAPGQGGRALTLVPDYHLCLVRASSVVHTVPEAFARLQPTATLPTTFFSGPSATADIEMTRIKGVHGPRFVDVILVLES